MKKERNEFYAYESSVENVQTSHPRKRSVLKKPFPCIKNVRHHFEIRLMTKSKAKQNANTSTIQNPNISVFSNFQKWIMQNRLWKRNHHKVGRFYGHNEIQSSHIVAM